MATNAAQVTQTLQAYPAHYLTVVDGYNLGAKISYRPELTLDDIYAISSDATPSDFSVVHLAGRRFTITQDSPSGTPGNLLHFDCTATLMNTLGDVVDVTILVETTPHLRVRNIYFMPQINLIPVQGYTLIGVSQEDPQAHYSKHAMAAFAQGTQITLASGESCPIEGLQAGDELHTHSDGVQSLLWIGKSTVRAVGDNAAVRIRAGLFNNMHDLVLSPDHRLLIHQKTDTLGIGRREVFVEARHLVNDDSILWEVGGYIDYYQLLFAKHQMVFAEGIAVETLRVTPRNRQSIPKAICDAAGIPPEGHGPREYDAFAITEAMLPDLDLQKLLPINPYS